MSPLSKVLFFLAISAFVSSCSLYKSDGRKSFESAASENINIQSFKPIADVKALNQLKSPDLKPINCDEVSPLTYWYETRITSPNTQWVESLPNLEVWQDQLDGSEIQIRTYEKHNDQQMTTITRCQATFSKIQDWIKYRAFYLKSLEGEQP